MTDQHRPSLGDLLAAAKAGAVRRVQARQLHAMKQELVRGAVRDNTERPRRVRRVVIPRPAYALPLAVVAVCLIAALAYVSVPPADGSRVRAASAAATGDWQPSAGVTPRERVIAAARREPSEPPRRLAPGVLPLAVKRIVLDAGHGGSQAGAVSDSGVTEKQITLDITLRLARLLAGSEFEVLLTRETDVTMSLKQRAAFANTRRADLFISIHVNWMPHRNVRAIETYYVGPSDDPEILRIASMENRDSGYSLASYRQLLERIYLDTRRDESRALARRINGELYRSLHPVNPALRDWGVKMAPFAVLIGTEMPAVLVEVSCLSNDAEVELLAKPDYREQIAVALVRGIRSYANELDRVGKREG